MKCIFKKLTAFVFALLLALSSVNVAFASEFEKPDGISPQYDYTQYVLSNLNITSSGKANVTIHCTGISGVTKKITAKTCIQRKVGIIWVKTDIGTSDDYWYDSSSSAIFNTSHTVQLSKSGTYRAKTVFTVYSSNDSEDITMYSGTDSY